MLLDFPPEVVQLVLLHCSTDAFLHAAVACRTLFSLACTTRELLLHHLSLIPGFPFDDDVSTAELFGILARRATPNLYGVERRATVFTFDYGITSRDRVVADNEEDDNAGEDNNAQASIDAAACAVRDSFFYPNIALASKHGGRVRLYRAFPAGVERVITVNLPNGLDSCVRTRRVVFPGDGRDTVAALQHLERLPDGENGDNHDMISSMPTVDPDGSPFLVPGRPHIALFHHHNALQSRSSRRRPAPKNATAVTLARLPDHGDADDNDEMEAIAFDMSKVHDVAILWRNRRSRAQKIVLYGRDQSKFPRVNGVSFTTYREQRWLEPPQNLDPPLVGVRFNDRASQLLYDVPGRLFYSHFQIIEPIGRVRAGVFRPAPNRDVVTCQSLHGHGGGGYFSHSFAIDIPFFSSHETYAPDDGGPPMCRWQYLALGGWFPSETYSSPSIGALLRAEAHCRAWNCEHGPSNLERGRRLAGWTVVARLRDFHPEAATQTSLTATTTTSEHGTRLAVAVGTAIRVWALEPTELLAHNARGYYPPAMLMGNGSSGNTSANTNANTSNNSTTNAADPADASDARAVVDLAPITLRAGAVVSALTFVQGYEDQLVAVTDRGVELWLLRPLAPGQRFDGRLPDTPQIKTYDMQDGGEGSMSYNNNNSNAHDDEEEDIEEVDEMDDDRSLTSEHEGRE